MGGNSSVPSLAVEGVGELIAILLMTAAPYDPGPPSPIPPSHPSLQITVMIIGNHSAGKSSFINCERWGRARNVMLC